MRSRLWKGNALASASQSAIPGKTTPLARTLAPQLAVVADHPPNGEALVQEVKFDGQLFKNFEAFKGGRETFREIEFYNLKAIFSIG